jgi:3-phenylpropionate/trans-cinnamate dioxygenase ferredoxin reductase subunit
MTERSITIVGGGHGGVRAAIALRENGWAGAIMILCEEPFAPYERPPLSKSALVDKGDPLPVNLVEPGHLDKLNIDTVFGAQVVRIDPRGHILTTRAHGDFSYDRLVLATGAAARRPPFAGGEHALSLRTFEDALALRRRLRPNIKMIVIGGGFIGLEVAASARNLGVDVTVLEAARRPLSRAVPEDLAHRLAARHAAAGVELVVGCAIGEVARHQDQYVVQLADGRSLTADLIVAGVGSAPRTELAADAGLEIDNGVAVNGALQTSDPDIFAIGDCCSFPHSLFGGKRIRLEAWRNAQDQGDYLGRNLTGNIGHYDSVPWFWSDQYELHLQIAGLPSEGAHIVRRELADKSSIDFHLAHDGRLVGVSALGALDRIAREARIAEKLIAARAAPDPEFLAKPENKLKSLLAS